RPYPTHHHHVARTTTHQNQRISRSTRRFAYVNSLNFGLGLTSCLFGGGAAGSGVGDREVLFDIEALVMGVLNGIDDPALGCADSSCAITGNSAGLPQMLGFGADDC
ncbi:hypothetical protein, partial [Mycobacterium canetti]|uniref:hypothetical protein n=1 Tax=Mycobacterium canetti TaxID=78331 RepID=UPI003D805852